MTDTALVVGGTGPTGPLVARGLSDIGYAVTILHRGTHELTEMSAFEHIHADPHFRETFESALGKRSFDVVVAMYGRLGAIAEVASGRCRQFVAVTGAPVYEGWFGPHRLPPAGMRIPTRETDSTVSSTDATLSRQLSFQHKIYVAEQRLLTLAGEGAFSACALRYPNLYGPRQVVPFEWRAVKRVLDGRTQMVIPENGLAIYTRCYVENAARAVLLAVSQPERANGQVFNCGDSDQFSVRQWLEMIFAKLGSSMELVSLPDDLAGPGRAVNPLWGFSTHGYLDTSKVVSVLGYDDVVPAKRALSKTVEWYLQHPPDGTPNAAEFDYAYEDRAISGLRQLRTNLAGFSTPDIHHPYAHPREPRLSSDERGR